MFLLKHFGVVRLTFELGLIWAEIQLVHNPAGLEKRSAVCGIAKSLLTEKFSNGLLVQPEICIRWSIGSPSNHGDFHCHGSPELCNRFNNVLSANFTSYTLQSFCFFVFVINFLRKFCSRPSWKVRQSPRRLWVRSECPDNFRDSFILFFFLLGSFIV